jgi:hypothetical protein
VLDGFSPAHLQPPPQFFGRLYSAESLWSHEHDFVRYLCM